MSDFSYIKELYEDGFRCIYYNSESNNHKIYLKNFDNEASEVIELTNNDDFNQFQNYINDLKMQ